MTLTHITGLVGKAIGPPVRHTSKCSGLYTPTHRRLNMSDVQKRADRLYSALGSGAVRDLVAITQALRDAVEHYRKQVEWCSDMDKAPRDGRWVVLGHPRYFVAAMWLEGSAGGWWADSFGDPATPHDRPPDRWKLIEPKEST